MEHFLPLTAPGGKDWRLLVMDGHGSHLTDEFLAACVVSRVFIVLLPAHSSHVTQPLDVGCFAPLKEYFRSTLADFNGEEFGIVATKQNFMVSYCEARPKAFSRQNVLSAWRGSGLWPTNINKVLNNPFVQAAAPTSPKAPSLVTEYDCEVLTPQGGKELRNLTLRSKRQVAPLARSQRAILQKAAKALDVKNTKIAFLQAEKRALERQVEDLRPKKKQKVIPTLGQRLVGIAQVQAVRQLAEIVQSIEGPKEDSPDIPLADTFLS